MLATEEGDLVYAYEVDGLGNALAGFDDPNVPSLLAIPLLNYPYDEAIYNATRARMFTTKNSYFFQGETLSPASWCST